MVEKDGKIHYEWTDYTLDLTHIAKKISRIKNPYIVGIYRGSLGMAAHISNVLDIKMGIINYQTRDGDTKEPHWLLNESTEENTIVVIDDIYDTGKTLADIDKIITNDAEYFCIFDNIKVEKQNPNLKVNISRVSKGEWIVFPIEIL